MVEAVKLEVTKTLTAVEIRTREEVPQVDDSQHVENIRLQHAEYEEAVVGDGNGDTAIAEAATKKKAQPIVRHTPKRSEEHTSELQSRLHLVCRLLLGKKT